MRLHKKIQLNWPFFNSFSYGLWYVKLINKFIRCGGLPKLDYSLFYLYKFFKGISVTPTLYFFNVFFKLKPLVDLKWKKKNKRSKGDVYYQIPYIINLNRGLKLALKWFIISIKKETVRKGTKKINYLRFVYDELIKLALNKETYSVLLKKAIYAAAVSNRAAVRYRW